MLSVFLEKASGYFDKQFLFSVWFPSFLFGAAGVLLYAVAAGVQTAIDVWSELPTLTQTWLSAGGLTLVTFFAYICHNLLNTIVRFYEGYWPEWMRWPRRILVNVHRRRWHRLKDRLDRAFAREVTAKQALKRIESDPAPDDRAPTSSGKDLPTRVGQFRKALVDITQEKEDRRADKLAKLSHQLEALLADLLRAGKQSPPPKGSWQDVQNELVRTFTERCRQEEKRARAEYNRLYAESYRAYPQIPAWLMPTRLGNVIRSAEEYSQLTYNFDAPTVWPRLVQLLPTEFLARLEQSSTPLTTMLFCATLSYLFALVGGIALYLADSHWWLIASTIAGGIVLGSWCYESAVQRAIEYGMLIRTACDLYRHELLKALQVPLPSSPLDEWKLWPQLMQWWYFYTPPLRDAEGKPAWYYEGKKPSPGGPKRDEHILYLKLGMPPREE